jgi:hypothetical protein
LSQAATGRRYEREDRLESRARWTYSSPMSQVVLFSLTAMRNSSLVATTTAMLRLHSPKKLIWAT